MTASPLLFYVSGHGFGHARRMSQVIREIRRAQPDAPIHIRSNAPARIFAHVAPDSVQPCELDAGLVERDPLAIDREKSLAALQKFMARRDEIIAREIDVVRQLRPRLIVADIPFLAGDVAAATNTRCIGVSNFTWDWIYENLFGDDSAFAGIANVISQSYSKFSLMMELPFGQTSAAIPQKVATPLIAIRSERSRADILAQLNISPGDQRPRILVGTRGGLAPGVLARAAAEAPHCLFLHPYPSAEPLPTNAMMMQLGPSLDFSDLMSVSSMVVSKLGYGMISECIATQTRLVWPPRWGFAEDQIVAADAPRFVPMLQISLADYHAGRWGNAIRRALDLPPGRQSLPLDGASICARLILTHAPS